MSRLNFENLHKEYEFIKPATIRFTRTDKMFTINTLDSVDNVYVNYKISEPDLKRLISIDSYSKEDKEVFKFSLREVEQHDLDDDTYNSISVCQYYFNLSDRILRLAKKQEHLYRLKRVDSPYLKLKNRQIHTNGGRPKGSKNKIDTERLEYLRANYDRIIQNCIRHNWPDEYVTLQKELGTKKKEKELYEEFSVLREKTFAKQ